VFLALVAGFIALFVVLLCLIPYRERRRVALSESQKALGKAEAEPRDAERADGGQPVLPRTDSSLVVHFAASPQGPPARIEMPRQHHSAPGPAIKPPNVQFVQVPPNSYFEPGTASASSDCVTASTVAKFSYNTSDMSIGNHDEIQAQASTLEHKQCSPNPGRSGPTPAVRPPHLS
jgi:hypothetical protein